MAQFSLKWNSHVSNMLTIMENLKVVESLVDVTLACELHTIKAHKLVLSTGSSFFHQLFLANPSQHPIIILHDIKYHTLKRIIDFLYKGEINVPSAEMEELLKTAQTLDIKGLPDICKEKLNSQNLDSSETHHQNLLDVTPLESTPQKRKRKRRSSGSEVIFDKVVPKMEVCTPPVSSEPGEFFPQISETRTLAVGDISIDSLPTYDDPLMLTSTAVQTEKKDATTECEVEPLRTIENNQTEQIGAFIQKLIVAEQVECPHFSLSDQLQNNSLIESVNENETIDSKHEQVLTLLREIIENQRTHSTVLENMCDTTVRRGIIKIDGIPARSLDEFVLWNNKLDSETDLNSTVEFLSTKCTPRLNKSVSRVMKTIMTDDVATHFNWAGRGEKIAFQETKVKNVVISAVKSGPHRKNLTVSDIEDAIKIWLKSASTRLKKGVSLKVELQNDYSR